MLLLLLCSMLGEVEGAVCRKRKRYLACALAESRNFKAAEKKRVHKRGSNKRPWWTAVAVGSQAFKLRGVFRMHRGSFDPSPRLLNSLRFVIPSCACTGKQAVEQCPRVQAVAADMSRPP